MNVYYPLDVAKKIEASLAECTLPQLARLIEVLFFASLLREKAAVVRARGQTLPVSPSSDECRPLGDEVMKK